MRLYHWPSNFMADWQLGRIVVMARNPDHARNIAKTAFHTRWPSPAPHALAAFESDIDPDPAIEPVGLFIRGSA